MDHKELRDLYESYQDVYQLDERHKGRHGQSETEYADSRSDAGKIVSGTSKMSGAEYTHGRRVRAANPGMQPDVGGKTKPKSQGKMDHGTRIDLEHRKQNPSPRKKVGGSKGLPESYNIILSHLLDEGYASTEKSADEIILNMSEAWFEDIMELNRYAKETKKDFKSGRPSVKGGKPEMNPDHPKNPKDGRKYGGSREEPKVPGKKPPVAGEPGSGRQTPAHMVALKRAHAERMKDQPIGSRFD